MKQFMLCALGCLFAAGPARGAEISGFIDMSYNWNLNDPPGGVNILHLYDTDNESLLFHSAHLAITGGVSDEVEYVIEIDAGLDAEVNSALSLGAPDFVDLQEAYINAAFGDSGLGLRAGKFESFAGIEKIEAPENPTFSRGLLFSAQPRTYTGAFLTFSDSQFDLAIGTVNGWDVFEDWNDEQTLVLNLGMKPSAELDFKITYMTGTEEYFGALPGNDVTLLHLSASFAVASSTTVSFEYVSGTEEAPGGDNDWTGIGIQAVFEGSEDFSLGLRVESLEGKSFGTSAKVDNITLAPALQLSGSTTLRFELRLDSADFDAFLDDTGAPTDKQTTFGIELFTRF